MNKNQLLSEVKKNGYFSSHSNVLVAVSTGLDSMNLLIFLNEVKDELEITLGIAHVNHHQRKESDTEEEFLKEWAEAHHIPIFISHYQGTFTEAKARQFRYQFFESIMIKEHYTALVTAHHADDQAETVFMRFIKSKHLKSLRAISDRVAFANGEIIHPFLTMKKEEFDTSIPHFEDTTNLTSSYFRNRIRNHYIPLLEQENPKFSDGLVNYANDITALYKVLDELSHHIKLGNVTEFKGYSVELQNYLIEQHLEKLYSLHLSKNEINQIVQIITTKSNAKHLVKNQIYLEKQYDQFSFREISIESDKENQPIMIEYGGILCYDHFKFTFLEHSKGIPIPTLSLKPIIVRRRKQGDKIKLNGKTKKLRRLFIDNKVAPQLRENAVIVEQENVILAVIVDDRCYLRNDSKDDIMKGNLYMEELEK